MAARESLTSLDEKVPHQPAILKNIAILCAWLGRTQDTVRALRRFADLSDIPLDDAVDAEALAQLIDEEVHQMIVEQQTRATQLLAENRELLDLMAEALLERETLDAEEIDALVAGRDLPERKKRHVPTYKEKAEAEKEKRRAASIFGSPKPVPSA